MLIMLNKVIQEAWADCNDRRWHANKADARDILHWMNAEEIYVNPNDVIMVRPYRVRQGWDKSQMPHPCRNVGRDASWWSYLDSSKIHIRQVGEITVLESIYDVERLVHEAKEG